MLKIKYLESLEEFLFSVNLLALSPNIYPKEKAEDTMRMILWYCPQYGCLVSNLSTPCQPPSTAGRVLCMDPMLAYNKTAITTNIDVPTEPEEGHITSSAFCSYNKISQLSSLWQFERQWTPLAHRFDWSVPSWQDCLGEIRSYGLRRGVSQGWTLKFKTPHQEAQSLPQSSPSLCLLLVDKM